MEENRKNLTEIIKEKSSEIFPLKDIHIVSFSVTARKAVVITIMKKGGISIEDCKLVSSLIGQYIPDDYDLQVQSPGIGFEIRKDSFNLLELFLQTPIKIFYKDFSNGKEVVNEIEGILTFIDKAVYLKKFEKKDKIKKTKKDEETIISIEFEKIVKVKTTFYPEEI